MTDNKNKNDNQNQKDGNLSNSKEQTIGKEFNEKDQNKPNRLPNEKTPNIGDLKKDEKEINSSRKNEVDQKTRGKEDNSNKNKNN